jgi:mRNA interferase MazF
LRWPTRPIQAANEARRCHYRCGGGRLREAEPAVVVQTDAFPEPHPSVVICQMTSDVVDAPDFHVTIERNEENGLGIRSQVTADKPVRVRRERIGQLIGRLTDADIERLNIALAFVVGLAE